MRGVGCLVVEKGGKILNLDLDLKSHGNVLHALSCLSLSFQMLFPLGGSVTYRFESTSFRQREGKTQCLGFEFFYSHLNTRCRNKCLCSVFSILESGFTLLTPVRTP